MSTNEPSDLSKWITLAATPTDKAILDAIAKQDGDTSQSAIVRRLIRQEGARRGINIALAQAEPQQPIYAD